MALSKTMRKYYRELLMRKQHYKCCYCGCYFSGKQGRPNSPTLEYLHRLADGGSDHPDNLATACYECNSHRGENTWLDWKTFHEEKAALKAGLKS